MHTTQRLITEAYSEELPTGGHHMGDNGNALAFCLYYGNNRLKLVLQKCRKLLPKDRSDKA